MSGLRNEAQEQAKFMGIAMVWWVLGLVLIVLAGAVYGVTRPWVVDMETAAVRKSNQYVTSAQTKLLDLMGEHQRIEVKITQTDDADTISAYRSQQAAILNQMLSTKALLDPAQMPASVRQFLAQIEN